MLLDDGTVIPSFLSVRSGPGASAFQQSMSDVAIRSGRIVAAYAPTSNENTNKKFWEYDVRVRHTNGPGSYTDVIYPRAQIGSLFGGIADTMRWRPRLGEMVSSDALSTGTEVWIACINGNAKEARIIGAPKHAGLEQEPGDADQEHFFLEINGIQLKVDQNGDLVLKHRGKTDAAGTVEDDNPEKNGTSIILDSNGDIRLSTGEEGTTLVHLDSQGKKVWVNANQEIELNATGNVKIKSSGVLTGDATDATLMGETFRRQQALLHETVIPLLTTLSATISTAGAGVTAAATQHILPVVGPIIGAAPLGAAGASLAAAGPLVASIMAAIRAFEAMDPFYLSKKNKSD